MRIAPIGRVSATESPANPGMQGDASGPERSEKVATLCPGSIEPCPGRLMAASCWSA
jgi:hypothetical protein